VDIPGPRQAGVWDLGEQRRFLGNGGPLGATVRLYTQRGDQRGALSQPIEMVCIRNEKKDQTSQRKELGRGRQASKPKRKRGGVIKLIGPCLSTGGGGERNTIGIITARHETSQGPATRTINYLEPTNLPGQREGAPPFPIDKRGKPIRMIAIKQNSTTR